MPLDATFNNRDEKTVTIKISGYENQFITVMPCHTAKGGKVKTECSVAKENAHTVMGHRNMKNGPCNGEEWMKCVWHC